MRFSSSLAFLSSVAMGASAAAVHGQNAEGTTMGPVAFLWPADRPWSASQDNIGPCGSASNVTTRSQFPLTQGEVALTIADDAWKVNFHISLNDNPTTEKDFRKQAISSVSEVEPGHQCYKVGALPKKAAAGSNATIRLEYYSDYQNEHGGRNQTFFTCADVTLVEANNFSIAVPCFNVTSSEFDSGDSIATSSGARVTLHPSSSDSESDEGLSKGTVAGITTGTIFGSFVIFGVFAFLFIKSRQSRGAAAAAKEQPAVANKETDADSFATTIV